LKIYEAYDVKKYLILSRRNLHLTSEKWFGKKKNTNRIKPRKGTICGAID